MLATKADIAELRAETRERFATLETKIVALRDELRADAAEREARLIRWFMTGAIVGTVVAVAGEVIAVLR